MNTIETLASNFEKEIEVEYSQTETVLKDDAQKRLALKEKKQEAIAYKDQSKERLEISLKNLGDKAQEIVPNEKCTHGDLAMTEFSSALELQKENFKKFTTELTRNM